MSHKFLFLKMINLYFMMCFVKIFCVLKIKVEDLEKDLKID